MKNIIYLFSILCVFFGCSKTETTSVTIHVIQENGGPVTDAQLKIYANYDDLYKGINQIDNTRHTDAGGNINFDWTQSTKIFLLIVSGCLTNFVIGTEADLTTGVNNVFNAVLKETGTVHLKSTSTNPYQIYVNGYPVMIVSGKGQADLKYIEAKKDNSIRVLQMDGYVIYPTDQTYKANLVCNQTISISFP